jgi:hypothetical protein
MTPPPQPNGPDVTDQHGVTLPALPEQLSALLTRSQSGHQFVVYGDCCIGPPEPGRDHEQHLAAVHAVLQRLDPKPEFVCFMGDMIWGLTSDHRPCTDAQILRAEWDRVLANQMKPLASLDVPVFRIPGNHDTFNTVSENVWRDVFADIPPNGPSGQQGLTYFERHDDLLVISINVYATAMGAASTVYGGRVDYHWVDRVLSEHADARYKLVMGHTPVFPVNGYKDCSWNMAPEFGKPFWDVLKKHRVDAYLTSHVIAFDVQVHSNVLQITTGGAGTSYGPQGCMPGPTEYHHLVQMTLDEQGFQGQVLDMQGQRRETFSWPQMSDAARQWRIRGHLTDEAPTHQLLTGRSDDELFARIEVSLVGYMPRLCVAIYDPRERYPNIWKGPQIALDQLLDLTIAIDPAMGPGGILARIGDGPFSSLQTDAAIGYTAEGWPQQWDSNNSLEITES